MKCKASGEKEPRLVVYVARIYLKIGERFLLSIDIVRLPCGGVLAASESDRGHSTA